MSRSKFVSLAIADCFGSADRNLNRIRSDHNMPNPTPYPNPTNPLKVTGSLPTTPLPPPDLNGPIQMQSVPVGPQPAPQGSVPPSDVESVRASRLIS